VRQREQLIEAVRDRIYRFRDKQGLLTRRARRDAADLAEMTDPDNDPNAAFVLGDHASRLLFTDFLRDLTHDGTTTPEIERSASALHHATRRLRADYPHAPTVWAGYAHTGT
jgi:hypothetical protein